jgi:hypothetical protein
MSYANSRCGSSSDPKAQRRKKTALFLRQRLAIVGGKAEGNARSPRLEAAEGSPIRSLYQAYKARAASTTALAVMPSSW